MKTGQDPAAGGGVDFRFSDVTRVSVIDRNGLAFERYNAFDGVQVCLQDGGRTLKVFSNLGAKGSES